MAARVSIRTYGLSVALHCPSARLLARARPRLPPGRAVATTGSDRVYELVRDAGAFTVRRNGRAFARRVPLAVALDRLVSDWQRYLATDAPDQLFIHAGVVAWRGRAILLPGRSMSGKSTLVAALVRAGAVYYSDEYAVLDGDGRVLPFARRLALRGQRATRHVPVERLGGRAGRRPLEVGAVVLCRYRPNAAFQPRALSPGRSVLALLRQTVAARARAELALTRLSRLATRVPCVVTDRGDATLTAPQLLAWAAARPR